MERNARVARTSGGWHALSLRRAWDLCKFSTPFAKPQGVPPKNLLVTRHQEASSILFCPPIAPFLHRGRTFGLIGIGRGTEILFRIKPNECLMGCRVHLGVFIGE